MGPKKGTIRGITVPGKLPFSSSTTDIIKAVQNSLLSFEALDSIGFSYSTLESMILLLSHGVGSPIHLLLCGITSVTVIKGWKEKKKQSSSCYVQHTPVHLILAEKFWKEISKSHHLFLPTHWFILR